MRLSSVAAAAAVIIIASGAGSPAHAAFNPAQQKCRDTVAKNAAKLAKVINKTLVACHKGRSSQGSPIDCNFISNDSDPKDKTTKAENKLRALVGGASDKCAPAGSPADVGYSSCPAPCAGAVPSITTFADVAECVICLTRSSAQSLRLDGQGSPIVPLNPAEATCHNELGRNQTKLYDKVLKERIKCQKKADKNGELDTTSCEGIDPKSKIAKTRGKAEGKVLSRCSSPVDLLELDSCSDASLSILNQCLFNDAETRGEDLFKQLYSLVSGVTTTTSTTSTSTTTTTTGGPTTTTTTLSGSQDAQCPDFSTVRLFAAVTADACATNADCTAASNPGNCDTGLGLCVTNSQLDTGWTGKAHNADVLQDSFIAADLFCPGPSPTCGECDVVGVSAETGNCRCSNDVRTKCSDPIGFDGASCGSGLACSVDADCKRCTGDTGVICTNDAGCAGVGGVCLGGSPTLPCNTSTGMCEGTCNCYLGSLLPLSSANVPACILNKLAQDISGTVNVDTGASDLTVRLRSVVYLGTERYKALGPCPICGGTCTAGLSTNCVRDEDCDTTSGAGDGVCGNFDPVAGDGLRGGTCAEGPSDGLSCDIDGLSTSFPAFPTANGGGVSLDCLPENGKNISGQGLLIDLNPTTGSRSLTANVDCGLPASFPPFTPLVNCTCRVCSGTANGSKIACNTHADCSAVGAGTCSSNDSAGEPPFPNQCDPGVGNGGDGFIGLCVDKDPGGPNPGIEGECFSSADDDNFCDGVLRGNGEPFLFCDTNADCVIQNVDVDVGNCSLTRRRACFLDTITAVGVPGPTTSTQAALFCIPPTINTGINGVAGLPGPGRALLQGTSEHRCSGDPGTIYTPGVGGCP